MSGTVIAAIDAGSNAVRLTISALTSGDLNLLESDRVAVRLGQGTFTQGALDPDTMDACVQTFARFRALFDHHGVTHYRAVATSAVRSARNREQLQDHIWKEAGIRLDIIDGDEEARLMSQAVAHAFQDAAIPPCMIDLGGGSLEISLKFQRKWRVASLPVGTVRLIEAFGLQGAMDDSEHRMVRRYTKMAMRTGISIPKEGVGTCVACGGNAEALTRLFGEAGPVPTLEVASLRKALPQLLSAGTEERMRRYRIGRDRAEVIAVAALVFSTVAKQLGAVRLLVPGVGVREGILVDLSRDLDARGSAAAGSHSKSHREILWASAKAFALRVGHDITHGAQVRSIAKSLFDDLQALHGLDATWSTSLEIAALLHDVGEVVHRSGHHKHSEYLIRNGRIPGLKGKERQIVSILARTHRKAPPDIERHEGFALLSAEDRIAVCKIAAILRIADGLDADHRQRFSSVAASTGEGKVTLRCAVKHGKTTALPTLEKVELFKEVFQRQLEIEVFEDTRS
ncbi:MAG: Ppx/GppA phosphatase family protein [Myxococcota bacterium]